MPPMRLMTHLAVQCPQDCRCVCVVPGDFVPKRYVAMNVQLQQHDMKPSKSPNIDQYEIS